MATAVRVAAELGQELQDLSRDDGARLEQILWRLAIQAKRAPADLDTASAYSHALALAGRALEARTEALRLFHMLGSDSDPCWWINAAGALADAGCAAFAMKCLEHVTKVAKDVVPDLVLAHATNVAVRYGELTWHAERFPPHPIVTFLREQNLAPWWPTHQRALEHLLGERVASTSCELCSDPEGGPTRLIMDYYTDAASAAEVNKLYTQVMDGLEGIFAGHPDGPGAFLGQVNIDVHGPEIPLPESP